MLVFLEDTGTTIFVSTLFADTYIPNLRGKITLTSAVELVKADYENVGLPSTESFVVAFSVANNLYVTKQSLGALFPTSTSAWSIFLENYAQRNKAYSLYLSADASTLVLVTECHM